MSGCRCRYWLLHVCLFVYLSCSRPPCSWHDYLEVIRWGLWRDAFRRVENQFKNDARGSRRGSMCCFATSCFATSCFASLHGCGSFTFTSPLSREDYITSQSPSSHKQLASDINGFYILAITTRRSWRIDKQIWQILQEPRRR